ncbi:alpha/beta hydrolase [Flavobacteriaceae bacterium M23B6Z8]
MKFYKVFFLTWGFAVFNTITVSSQETIEFASEDGLQVTADLYKAENSENFIVLFHQAGWSRGEYKEIAPWLVAMGYNCLAVDLRSGSEINGVKNLTNSRAVKKGLPTNYKDALPDIEAAVSYVKQKLEASNVILWGSSYSAALVLKYAGENPGKIQAVLSFAPGEYFGKKDYISSSARSIKIPVFITSAREEAKNWRPIYDAIESDKKVSFLPETKGNHGSRALWSEFEDHEAYRKEVRKFLKTI